MITRIVLSALALGFAVAAVPAAARGSVDVSYKDLDLNEPADQLALERRLNGAVRSICGSPVRGIKQLIEYRTCRADAHASYKRQVKAALDRANAP